MHAKLPSHRLDSRNSVSSLDLLLGDDLLSCLGNLFSDSLEWGKVRSVDNNTLRVEGDFVAVG